jgi:hypothetical protein
MSRVILLSLALAAGAVTVASCAATPNTSATTTILTPDYAEFAGSTTDAASDPGVHAFLERRCGTLDCHGQVSRPFRLFSQNGLRLANDSGIVSGGQPDTPEEIYNNYLSAIGLQPEETSRVVAGDDPPTDLLLVTKPSTYMMETHKGGQVIEMGDVSYDCLTTWLTSNSPPTAAQKQLVSADCAQAALIP